MPNKLFLKRKYFKEKMERTRQSLLQKHLLEIDGSGDQEIEWLMAIVTLLAAGELELEDDEVFYKLPPGKHKIKILDIDQEQAEADYTKKAQEEKLLLGTESPLSTEQD